MRTHRPATCGNNPPGKSSPSEEEIDIFQLQAFCFGEEKEDGRHPEEVESGEDNEYAPADIFCNGVSFTATEL